MQCTYGIIGHNLVEFYPCFTAFVTRNMEFAPVASADMHDHVLKLRFYIFHTPLETLSGYFKTYLATELLTLAAVSSQCLLWDFIFDWQFRHLGVRYFQYFMDTYYWGILHRSPMLFYFPPRAACTRNLPSVRSFLTDDLQFSCIMPQNFIYQTVRFIFSMQVAYSN